VKETYVGSLYSYPTQTLSFNNQLAARSMLFASHSSKATNMHVTLYIHTQEQRGAKKNEENGGLFSSSGFLAAKLHLASTYSLPHYIFSPLYITEYVRTTSTIGARQSGHLPPVCTSSFAHFEQVHMCPHLPPSPKGFKNIHQILCQTTIIRNIVYGT
jgi:hypothetical protein